MGDVVKWQQEIDIRVLMRSGPGHMCHTSARVDECTGCNKVPHVDSFTNSPIAVPLLHHVSNLQDVPTSKHNLK